MSPIEDLLICINPTWTTFNILKTSVLTISSSIICSVSHLFDKTGSNILQLILKLDGFSYSNTIFGNLWSPKTLLNDDISPLTKIRRWANLQIATSRTSLNNNKIFVSKQPGKRHRLREGNTKNKVRWVIESPEKTRHQWRLRDEN